MTPSPTQSQKLAFDISRLMRNKESLEIRLTCSFEVAEQTRSELIKEGFHVLLFRELKDLYLGVWKKPI